MRGVKSQTQLPLKCTLSTILSNAGSASDKYAQCTDVLYGDWGQTSIFGNFRNLPIYLTTIPGFPYLLVLNTILIQ